MKLFVAGTVIYMLTLSFIDATWVDKDTFVSTYSRSQNIEGSPIEYFMFRKQDNWFQYYIVSSINSDEPVEGDNKWNGIEGFKKKPPGSLDIKVWSGPAMVQLKKVNSNKWYTLMPHKKNKKQEILDIAVERNRSALSDSSAYFDVKYTNKYKIIAGYRAKKIIMKNKVSSKIDSVYIIPQLDGNLCPFSIYKEKYQINGFIAESYEYYKGTILTTKLLNFERKKLSVDFSQMLRTYKIMSTEEFKNWLNS